MRGAQQVEVLTLKDKRKVATLNKEDDEGLFAGFIPRRVNPFPYLLRVTYPQSVEEIVDPYQFQSLLTEQDVYLFAEGKLRHAYQFLGANPELLMVSMVCCFVCGRPMLSACLCWETLTTGTALVM